jgi:hypothetical protein
MAISEAYTGSAVTVGTTELSLVSGTTTLQTITTDGVYQAFIDCDNVTVTDVFILRVYEKATSGSTKRPVFEATIGGANLNDILATPPLVLMHGWDLTLQKSSGTDRAFTWSIRQVS